MPRHPATLTSFQASIVRKNYGKERQPWTVLAKQFGMHESTLRSYRHRMKLEFQPQGQPYNSRGRRVKVGEGGSGLFSWGEFMEGDFIFKSNI